MFDNFPLWPARASSSAANVDALYIFLVLLSAFMCAAIFTTILVFALKYRRRAGEEAEQIEGSTALELTWSIIPMFIFVFIFALGGRRFISGTHPPRDSAEVYVVAKQWMWKLQHQEGPREINQLHVPLGRNIKFDHDFARCDPQLFLPFPHSASSRMCCPGATPPFGSAPLRRALLTCSAHNIAGPRTRA